MAIVYVVNKIDWQYNDNYYYTSEESGGNPVNLFTDKKNAV